ncbi:uncharacterized protein LOC132723322 [Ruditapes philippinarum]|uniref:uncharacterized protein LOC132723322 n=1 Tax=Ruditapes philippinarum TaxID=129788 RepID=UPI00295A8F1E|nr:uncharacterized protein LOC132723322 [Ruditapes philippinarum]
MSNLTDEEIHEVFCSFDTDGSGKLNMTELSDALYLLGIDLTPEELTESYRIDDDPESLSEEEFSEFIRGRIGDTDFAERCRECLDTFDEEHTGELSREKMKEILTQRGTHPLSDEEAEELLDEFDADGSNTFNIEEIVNMMYSQKMNGNDAPQIDTV